MTTIGMQKVLDAGFDEALGRVEAALKVEGFGILTAIDVKETLKKKLDVDFRRYRILGACNPPLAHRAFGAELAIGVFLPCNVAVYEADDGRTVVTAVDPLQTIGSVAAGRDDLVAVAREVRERLARVLAALGG